MSRTDKDTPWWVTAQWWEPTHMGCDDASAIGRIGRHGACDLPARPMIKSFREPHPFRRCHWSPEWERRYHRDGPPRWYVHHVWHGRERVAARDECRAALKEHRAGGPIVTEPTVRQARGSAYWLWC